MTPSTWSEWLLVLFRGGRAIIYSYSSSSMTWTESQSSIRPQELRLLFAAARLLSGTKKFDRGLSQLSQLMHVDLHWLDVPERVKYKLVTVYNCLHGKAPSYLIDCCAPISDVVSRRYLRSASRRQLLVPRHNLSTSSSGFFCRGSGCLWNCLCFELREPLLTANSFRQSLKTRLFAEY